MEDTPIIATFIWTFDEVKARQAALAGKTVTSAANSPVAIGGIYGFLIVTAVALISIILAGQKLTPSPQNNLLSIAVYSLPFFVMVAVFIFVQKQNWKRSFLQSPDSNKRVIVTFTSDEIMMTADNVYETRWKWATLIEVRRTPKGFCFFQAPQTGFWIPLHAFQSAQDVDAISEMANRLTPKFTVTAF